MKIFIVYQKWYSILKFYKKKTEIRKINIIIKGWDEKIQSFWMFKYKFILWFSTIVLCVID